MLYIKYVIFCFNLKHYKEFLSYDGMKGKNHKLEIRTIDRKIKTRAARGKNHMKEHVFLSMFYESLSVESYKDQQEELVSLFCMLYFWHYSLEAGKETPIVEEKTETEDN